ncbi:SusC/RagA family TonB-linked outer membrane protein [Sediminitomix flava]|uniref:TonB-linked SusC/RagA family outer membrane protein n=1 Tax=Sediminitomix flava TaxID=379075 RepID=A0A315ZFP0_SEDFL|nr:SusC/RagA family TonB-linked outer membrane protein [Sediminitomix flava]PWJ44406.1 TonB-linked SusC/RagA family outer membrane protein [Sediminitomix flava]
MRLLKVSLFGMIALFCSTLTFAQERTISGVVRDASDKTAVIGANIVVKGTSNGTITNFDGAFTLLVPEGKTALLITYVGYKPQEVEIGTESEVEVFMEIDAEELQEVVVTAFGVKQEKKALNYAVQEVNAAELVQSKQSNMVNALQGKVAGVQITSGGGMPGASSQIMIRGANSLTGDNQPLFVIDGIPIDNSSQNGGVNRAADINPNDIESMTVLKGPAAAALYGMDGANGAIIITTKSGKAGETQVTFSSSVDIDKVGRLPEQQKKYSQGSLGLANDETMMMWGPLLRPDEKTYNNPENFYQTAAAFTNSATISGGTENTTAYASINNLTQDGVVPMTGYDKTSILLKGTFKLRDNLRVGASANYINSTNIRGALNYSGGFARNVMLWPSTKDITHYKEANGEKVWALPSLVTDTEAGPQFDNKLWVLDHNPVEEQNNRLIVNTNLNWQPFESLNISYRLGRDEYTNKYERKMAYSTVGYFQGGMDRVMSMSSITTSTITASFNKTFNQSFTLSALVGNNVEMYESYGAIQEGRGLLNKDLISINNMEEVFSKQSTRKRNRVGVFGDVKLDYKGVAYVNVTGRNDWSSTMPVNNRSFFYPAVSGGIVFGELLPENNILSYGKLHVSYAQVGKDAPIQKLYPTLTPYLGANGGFVNYHTAGNPNLKPERTESREIGIDMAFLDGRLRVEGAVYNQVSHDQIITARISPVTGYIIQTFNSGTIDNSGWELMIDADIIKKADFTWNSTLNLSQSKSTLEELPSFVSEYVIAQAQVMGNTAYGSSFVGETVFGVTGTDYARTPDGQMIIGENGYPVVDTQRKNIGDRMPDLIAGWTNSFTYKNFGLSFLFDCSLGGDVLNANSYHMITYGQDKMLENYRDATIVFDGVVPVTDEAGNTTYKKNEKEVVMDYDYYRDNYQQVGTNFVEDVNWLRLRYVTFSYRLPNSLLDKWKIKDVEFSATGRNLLLFTNYSGGDPEVNSTGSSTAGAGTMGIDYFGVPPTKGFTFGVNAKF